MKRTRPESGCCVTTNKQTGLLNDVKNSCLQQVLDLIHNFFSFFDAVYILKNSKKYFNDLHTHSLTP